MEISGRWDCKQFMWFRERRKRELNVLRTPIHNNPWNPTNGHFDPFTPLLKTLSSPTLNLPNVLKAKTQDLTYLQSLGGLSPSSLPLVLVSALILLVMPQVLEERYFLLPVGLCRWHSSPHPPVNTYVCQALSPAQTNGTSFPLNLTVLRAVAKPAWLFRAVHAGSRLLGHLN